MGAGWAGSGFFLQSSPWIGTIETDGLTAIEQLGLPVGFSNASPWIVWTIETDERLTASEQLGLPVGFSNASPWIVWTIETDERLTASEQLGLPVGFSNASPWIVWTIETDERLTASEQFEVGVLVFFLQALDQHLSKDWLPVTNLSFAPSCFCRFAFNQSRPHLVSGLQ